MTRTDNRPYHVAYNTKFSHVRGLAMAHQRLAEYLGIKPEDVKRLRRKHNCAGYIKRISAEDARAVGI